MYSFTDSKNIRKRKKERGNGKKEGRSSYFVLLFFVLWNYFSE